MDTAVATDKTMYIDRPAVECGTIVVQQDNGGTYRRSTPVIAGPVAYWIVNALQPHLDEDVNPPPAKVIRLQNATVRGPGIITLPGNLVVRESLANCHDRDTIAGLTRLPEPHSFETNAEFTEGRPMPAGNYVLLKQMWDGNYGHWLVECLPRVKLVLDLLPVSECYFIVSAAGPAMKKVFVDSLAVFGIPENRIIVSGYEPLCIENLFYPLPLTVQPWIKAPIVVSIIEAMANRLLQKRGQPWRAEKLFIWRPDTSRRVLRNQAQILETLVRRGYAVVVPGIMTFEEQVTTFSTARWIVGVLGAECTNIIFSQTGCRFFGLAPEHMQDDFFWDLVSHKQGRYFSLHGPSEDPQQGMNSPFSIDTVMFETMLDEFENNAA